MSISLIAVAAGLPIALAARVIMGKDKFEEWINSSDYRLCTNFENLDSMVSSVRAAKYDIGTLFGQYKTHFKSNDNSYFLWELQDEKVVAVMSVHDNKDEIRRFIDAVEKVTGRKTFFEPEIKQSSEVEDALKKAPKRHPKTPKVAKQKMEDPVVTDVLPTIFTDEMLLVGTLRNFGMKMESVSRLKIYCSYHSYQLAFVRNHKEEPFNLQVSCPAEKMRLFFESLHLINQEYCATVQEKTYQHVLNKLAGRDDVTIIDDEVLEDNSIVITLNING